MATPSGSNGSNGRVTNAELREVIRETEVRMRRELRLTVLLGLVGGQALASVMTSLITGAGTAEQVRAVLSWIA